MKKITVYTTFSCAYCVMAKRLLARLELDFEEVDVSHDTEKRMWLVQTTGQRTVPQIFFGEQSIGGYTELSSLERRGELMTALQSDA